MRIPKGEGRERLVSAATTLFLKYGYEATSPQAIYAESGVGQGSFYYHFSNKDALLNVVLMRMVESEIRRFLEINVEIPDPLNRLDAYLRFTRVGTEGCKFGRFIYETSMVKAEMAEPIREYFSKLLEFLEDNLTEATDMGTLGNQTNAKELAQTIVSQIQGGYVLSRVYQDDAYLERNLTALRRCLGLPST